MIVLYLVFGHNGILKYNELISIRDSYEVKINDMSRKIENMQKELDSAKKDKEYLENKIRSELGMMKPNEDLYIIKDNNSK